MLLLVALLAGMYVYDQGQRNLIAKGVRVAGVDLGASSPTAPAGACRARCSLRCSGL